MFAIQLSLLVLATSGNSQIQLTSRPSLFSPIPRSAAASFRNQFFFPTVPPTQNLSPQIKPRSSASSGTFSPSPRVHDTVVGLGVSGKDVGDFLSSGWAGLRQQRHILPQFSTTLRPLLVTPTTIRFTLDDVHAPLEAGSRPLWHPPLPLDFRPVPAFRSSRNSVSAVLNAPFTKFLARQRQQVETPTAKTTTTTTTKLPIVNRQPTITLGGFRPSPSFPIFDLNNSPFKAPATKHPNISKVKSEVRNSNTFTTAQITRQPKTLNYFGSESNIFSVRSTISPSLKQALFLAKELASNSIILKNKQSNNLSSILTDQSKLKETETNEVTTTNQPPKKTFQFNQEFLSLLKKKNNTYIKPKSTTTKSPSSTTILSSEMPFWFRIAEETSLQGKWRLKGGARAPATQLRVKFSSLDDSEVSSGPKVVPLGVQGEVGHADEGPSGFSAPIVKHGVQSLNVSAWVMSCPKLYGDVELRCTVDHDPLIDNQMTMMWKKKSYTLGVPQEKLLSLDESLVLQDTRFSLTNGKDHSYSLHIRDFRPSDCGTYECQAKAKQATAASQLLLFTCL